MFFTRLNRYLYKPSFGSMFSSGYVSDLTSSTISCLVASFGFMSVSDFVLFILFKLLSRFLTQIVYCSGSWSSWLFMGFNNCFANYLLKASSTAMLLCLCFVVLRMLTFLKMLWNSFPLSHWITFGYLNMPTFLYITSNTNTTLLVLFVLKAPVPLHLDAISTSINVYLYMFPSKTWDT